jgi:hypothetical protein
VADLLFSSNFTSQLHHPALTQTTSSQQSGVFCLALIQQQDQELQQQLL